MKIASKKGYMEMVEFYFLETLKSVLGSSKIHYYNNNNNNNNNSYKPRTTRSTVSPLDC